jgi:hypothetical protein
VVSKQQRDRQLARARAQRRQARLAEARRRKRRRVVVAGIVVGIVALVAVGVFVARSQDGTAGSGATVIPTPAEADRAGVLAGGSLGSGALS